MKTHRTSAFFKMSLSIIFALTSFFILIVVVAEGTDQPENLEGILRYKSFADFILSNVGGLIVGFIVALVGLILVKKVILGKEHSVTDRIEVALEKIEQGQFNSSIGHRKKDSDLDLLSVHYESMKESLASKFIITSRVEKELDKIIFDLRKMLVDNRLGKEYLKDKIAGIELQQNSLKEILEGMQFSGENKMKNVLVIGGGGREHAIVKAVKSSRNCKKVFVAPGSKGMESIAELVDLPLVSPFVEIVNFAKERSIDLAIIGPEIYLVDGIAEHFRAAGIEVFGPDSEGAKIEGSKSFAKKMMKDNNIPTAGYEEFSDYKAAVNYLATAKAPFVIKADGLAAGKGVFITSDKDEATQVLSEFMVEAKFGESGKNVIIEEFLVGEEASLLAFIDNKTIKPMVSAQDHKNIFEGDKGPNTGGMGAYAPAPVMTPELSNEVRDTILLPMLKGFQNAEIDYRGLLYVGLMITADGPKVIEFNCRFGDPEAQVVFPLLKSDFLELALATATNKLEDFELIFDSGSAVCVVLASEGYPGKYKKGSVITGLESVIDNDVTVYHSGTTKNSAGEWATTGGRVLGVTAKRDNLQDAVSAAYINVEKIKFDGMQYRTDIAKKGLKRG